MNPTRRNVLAGTAALSLLPLAARAGAQPEVDVAIVGGGVSGVYAAWRLRAERPDLKVALFEMSGRIGGRLRSIAFPQAPHLVGEAGGMRFLPSQRHVYNLVQHLGLPARIYPVFEPQDRLDLRGRTFSYAESGQPTKLYPYSIPPSDQSPTSKRFGEGLANAFPQFHGRMTPQTWLRVRTHLRYKGRLLKDLAAWAFMANIFTDEEMRFFNDTGGYDIAPSGSAQGFLDQMIMGDDESKPFYTIAGGYQKLPLMLAAEAKRLGAHIAPGTTVASVFPMPERCTIQVIDGRGRGSTVIARQIVFALPRRAIESIRLPFPATPSSHFGALLASVEPVPACKAFLLYKDPWWKYLGIDGGRSVTDMQARMFYPLGAEKVRLKSEPTNGYGLLMMYCCGNTTKYWQELAPQTLDNSAGFQWLAGNSELASEIHREAGLTFASNPPPPLAACFQDWTAEPFGGAWHSWAQGVDEADVADAVMKPFADRNLYICGEAYSPFEQAWVEGALERAETMLQRHFGLRQPQWLG
ncbi:MAG: FAD-dependent oxidoreductase [Rhizomicrobium sp.]